MRISWLLPNVCMRLNGEETGQLQDNSDNPATDKVLGTSREGKESANIEVDHVIFNEIAQRRPAGHCPKGCM